MSSHGRKYGEKDSHPIPVWNGVFEHFARIGEALWVFEWCLDGITKETDGIGLVHGGAPVKLKRIAADLKGIHQEMVRRHLKKLVDGKYLRMRRTAYGQIIEVLNSKKFGIWKKEKPQKVVSLGVEKHTGVEEKLLFVGNKEDSAVTQQEERRNPAAKPAPPADPRFQPFFDFAFESFAMRHGRKPLWLGKDHSQLKSLLKSHGSEGLGLERLKTNWRNFLASTEPFIVKQGGSLGYFCSNIDKFSDGPILAGPRKGINGKLSGTELAIHNAKAVGLYRPN